MIRILFALCVAAGALLSVSCCCTSEAGAPKLRPLPQFREIEAAPPAAPEVLHEK